MALASINGTALKTTYIKYDVVIQLLNKICNFRSETKWSEVNLNKEAMAVQPAKQIRNPFLDPEICNSFVKYVTKLHEVDYTYGGLYEDRSYIWQGSYLKPDSSIHLGIDINVPFGTSISCPVDFKVVDIFIDPDNQGGWGGRIIVETKNGLVLFGHLEISSASLRLAAGGKNPAGTMLGFVAASTRNGGWYPHLHLQGIDSIKSISSTLDGYGHISAINKSPNPLMILNEKT